MPNVIKRFTLTAFDDNTVTITDEAGFMFPPTLIAVFDDFNGVGIFNAGPWNTKEVGDALVRLALQVKTGDTKHYRPGAKPDGRE